MRLRILASSVLIISTTYFAFDFSSENSAPNLDNSPSEANIESSTSAYNKKNTAYSASKIDPDIARIIPNTEYENYQSKYGPLAPSLRGTKIPGYFELDPSGHLVVTPSIKSVIEYFLSALGEESIEVAVARIEEYFSKHLTEPATTDAIDILAQYIHYKEALVDLEQISSERNAASTSGHDYLELFRLRNEIRLNSLSPEVYEAFFLTEEKLDIYAARVLELKMESRSESKDITDELQKLEDLLPEEERAIRSEERTRQQISHAKAQGATEEELYTMRANAYGHEAAVRFAKAESKAHEWNKRYLEYSIKKTQILASEGLSEKDKEEEITILKASLFSEYERKRLATLDLMNSKKAAL
jgi:lipase chaperone LimK